MHVSTPEIVAFHRKLTSYYYESGRHDMLWRKPDRSGKFEPYKIMVSEIMLQQTQVDRVTPKYEEFLAAFPAVRDLAGVSLGDVLKVWNGLGYNRRAKYIWQAAGVINQGFKDLFPETLEELQRLPGVGPNTAGAIIAYAYNEPVVFIETNVRTVMLHHFFKDRKNVSDASIRKVMELVIPKSADKDALKLQGAILGPREFYWAMMDYGSHLKKTLGNLNRASKHYARQPTFKGSARQIRGEVIRLLADREMTEDELQKHIPDERLTEILAALQKEDLITKTRKKVRLS